MKYKVYSTNLAFQDLGADNQLLNDLWVNEKVMSIFKEVCTVCVCVCVCRGVGVGVGVGVCGCGCLHEHTCMRVCVHTCTHACTWMKYTCGSKHASFASLHEIY